jgi:hypothetical protein
VTGIQAQQLEDFAAQVYCWISTDGNGQSHNVLASLGKSAEMAFSC